MTGVLSGFSAASGTDFRDCEAFVGTSAGAIVAASLAAGRPPRAPGDAPRGDAAAHQAAPPPSARPARGVAGALARSLGDVSAPALLGALRAAQPIGARARALALGRAPDGGRSLAAVRREVESWGVRFDGRLRICTLDRATGRRVVFGAPGAPTAGVGEAVEASCAVPWVFRPVTIGGRVYVDGGAWSLTNLDAAPAGRDTRVLCLTVAGGAGRALSAAGAMRALARPAATVEALALRRRGAHVRIVAPDHEAAAALGPNLLDPRASAAALAAGHAQGRRLAAASTASG